MPATGELNYLPWTVGVIRLDVDHQTCYYQLINNVSYQISLQIVRSVIFLISEPIVVHVQVRFATEVRPAGLRFSPTHHKISFPKNLVLKNE